MKSSTVLTTLALCLPLAALGQAYKCTQANGSVAFQDRPCQSGQAGGSMALPTPATGQAPAPGPAPKPRMGRSALPPGGEGSAADRQRAEEIEAQNEKTRAYNQQLRCNHARRQLDVLKAERPVYTLDNKGERTYMKDEERPAKIAAAQRAVAESCQ